MRTREGKAGLNRPVFSLFILFPILVAFLIYVTRDPRSGNGAVSVPAREDIRPAATGSRPASTSAKVGGSSRPTREASPVAPAFRPGLQPPSDLAATDETTPESPAAALARKQELQFARARRAAAKTGVPAPTAGEPPDARAEVVLNGKTHDLEPGPSGTFPDLQCQALSTANVSVVYASGNGPPDVIIQAEDGGAFLDGSSVKAVHLDEANTARFTFISGVQYGHYRLTLRRGADIKTIPFWVETADPGRERQGSAKR